MTTTQWTEADQQEWEHLKARVDAEGGDLQMAFEQYRHTHTLGLQRDEIAKRRQPVAAEITQLRKTLTADLVRLGQLEATVADLDAEDARLRAEESAAGEAWRAALDRRAQRTAPSAPR